MARILSGRIFTTENNIQHFQNKTNDYYTEENQFFHDFAVPNAKGYA